jgi:cystathionine beta-lyase/cystathionine gamma-synthase
MTLWATSRLLYTVFGPFGVKVVTEDFRQPRGVACKAFELQPRVLICETLSNPLLNGLRHRGCAEIAHEVARKLIVDNTFATPYLCRRSSLGRISLFTVRQNIWRARERHGGVVVAKDEIDKPALLGALTLAGGVLSPWKLTRC